MVELKKRLTILKTTVMHLLPVLPRHRIIYLGLATCHGSGSLITQKPEFYGPMAVLYAILALRG
ncbi:MAG: hypothetical protein ACKVH0_17055 [Alphaproteobacteria bacterium]